MSGRPQSPALRFDGQTLRVEVVSPLLLLRQALLFRFKLCPVFGVFAQFSGAEIFHPRQHVLQQDLIRHDREGDGRFSPNQAWKSNYRLIGSVTVVMGVTEGRFFGARGCYSRFIRWHQSARAHPIKGPVRTSVCQLARSDRSAMRLYTRAPQAALETRL